MLMSSLATIQASAVYTPSTVPVEKTYGLPAKSKNGPAAAPSSATTSESSPPSTAASDSVTWSP